MMQNSNKGNKENPQFTQKKQNEDVINKLLYNRDKLARKLFRPPTPDELWTEIGILRYSDFIELLESVVKEAVSGKKDDPSFGISDIESICSEWGITGKRKDRIVDWAEKNNFLNETHNDYNRMTNLDVYLQEKNNIPDFKEENKDIFGNPIKSFDDTSYEEFKTDVHRLHNRGDYITPEFFHSELCILSVPKRFVNDLAKYVVSLNRKTALKQNEKKSSMTRYVRKEGELMFSLETENKVSQNADQYESEIPAKRSDNPEILFDRSEKKDNEEEIDASSTEIDNIAPLDPLELFGDFDNTEEAEAEDIDSVMPVELIFNDEEADSDQGVISKTDDTSSIDYSGDLKSSFSELNSFLSQNRTQTSLLCDMQLIIMHTGETRIVNIISLKDVNPRIKIESGKSAEIKETEKAGNRIRLTVNALKQGVSIINLVTAIGDSIKLGVFVFED